MNLLNSVNQFTTKAKSTFKRFPVTIIWAILGTFFTIWFINQKIKSDLEFNYIKIILTAILGVSWLIATRLLINYFKEEKFKNTFWLIIIPLILLAVYYFKLPNDAAGFDNLEIPYRFIIYLIIGHLFIFFSPFLFTWNKNSYWNYLKSIFLAFATSVLFSLVLYLGLVLALMALKFLFKVEIKSEIYFELFVFCLGIINTWIFLTELPKNINKNTKINYPKALLVFVKYILIPLTILYLIILYAYSFKILLKWSLPKGWVSYLVVALSVLGFLIHILINPIRKTAKSRIIKKFYPWFYYALLPMILLLFVAIFKRVTDYGFTENRYLVLILALWILGMTIYILFSKRKKLRYFPMSVAILSILVSFGFWGMFSVAKNSQAMQFKNLYIKMKSNNFKVSSTNKYRFENLARYLVERNATSKINDIIGFNFTNKLVDVNKWNIPNKLSDTLGIKIIKYDNKKHIKKNYYYTLKSHQRQINIKGYDYLKQVYFGSYNVKSVSKYNTNHINNYNFKIDSLSYTAINVMKNNEKIYEIDLKPLITKLVLNDDLHDLTQEKLTLIKEFGNLKIKILFQDLKLKNEKDGQKIPTQIIHASAIVLLKEK